MEHSIFFPDRSGVGGVRFSAKALPPEDPIMKAGEYAMIDYFLEILNPENPFFNCLTKFQKCIFKRIYQVFTLPDKICVYKPNQISLK